MTREEVGGAVSCSAKGSILAQHGQVHSNELHSYYVLTSSSIARFCNTKVCPQQDWGAPRSVSSKDSRTVRNLASVQRARWAGER